MCKHQILQNVGYNGYKNSIYASYVLYSMLCYNLRSQYATTYVYSYLLILHPVYSTYKWLGTISWQHVLDLFTVGCTEFFCFPSGWH